MGHQPHPDPRSTAQLVRLALDRADPRAREALAALQWRGTREVLASAEELCADPDPRARELGADILGQLGMPQRAFPDECVLLLIDMLRRERDDGVVQAIAIALGHLRDRRAIGPLLELRDHPSALVRYGVAYGLHCHDDERAIEALIALSRDEDDDVRSWATFALGSQIPVDSVAIRHALLARARDHHPETRGEALLGLARRGEDSVMDPLMEALGGERVHRLVLEAAGEVRDPRLRPLLTRLRVRPGIEIALLEDAIHRCSG